MSQDHDRFARQAEVLRLARLFGKPATQLEFLAKVDTASLQQLRHRATSMLYDADREPLQRVAQASRLLPVALTALIAEKAFGPLLCARVAGLMPPPTAIEIAKRLPNSLLADVCVLLDPRRAQAVIDGIPLAQMIAVSLELARRREYVTMGQFVDVLSIPALKAVMLQLRDDLALLKIAFFVEDRSRLNRIVAELPEKRFDGIIDAALADDGAHWPEALALISELDLRWCRKFGELALTRGADTVADILRISERAGLLSALVPLGEAVIDSEAAINSLYLALRKQELALVEKLAQAARSSPLFDVLAAREWPAKLRKSFGL